MSRNSRRSRDARLRMELYPDRSGDSAVKADGPIRRGVFLLPATITSIGLLSGFYSMVSAVTGHFEVAAVMIVIAFFCDGLDGRVARASRTSTQFGVEYDSLSDVVAFGVAADRTRFDRVEVAAIGAWANCLSRSRQGRRKRRHQALAPLDQMECGAARRTRPEARQFRQQLD